MTRKVRSLGRAGDFLAGAGVFGIDDGVHVGFGYATAGSRSLDTGQIDAVVPSQPAGRRYDLNRRHCGRVGRRNRGRRDRARRRPRPYRRRRITSTLRILRLALFGDGGDDRADRDFCALGHEDRGEDTRGRRQDGEGGLVGLRLRELLALGDSVADRLDPLDDRALQHRHAFLREADRSCHQYVPSTLGPHLMGLRR